MNILITGAAGFIGSHLARHLLWRGDTVIGLDNFNDYYERKCKEFNVKLTQKAAKQSNEFKAQNKIPETELNPIYQKIKEYYQKDNLNSPPQTQGDYHFYEADITDIEALKDIFNNHKIDVIVHFAAMAGVPYSTKKPLLYTKVNVEGTVNLLTLSNKYNVEKFLFASSSSVYGHRGVEHVKETDDVTKARSVYGATKVAGEVIAHSFHTSFGLKVANMRIFGPIYGPLQRPYGMLHQRAINYTHNGKTLSIYGRSGLETAKDATYIDDEVQGFIKVIDTDFNYEVFNIGTANPLTIQHWLDCIQNAFNELNPNNPPKLNIEISDVDKADVTSSADISKAREKLEYNPTMQMQEGIKRQVEVFMLMPSWYQEMQDV